MNNELKRRERELKKALKYWKLAKVCPECEEEKKEYGEQFCFDHEWDNPIKLKKDRQMLTIVGSMLIMCFLWVLILIIYSITKNLGSVLDWVSGSFALILLTLFSWFLWNLFKDAIEDLKDKESWWVRKKKHE